MTKAGHGACHTKRRRMSKAAAKEATAEPLAAQHSMTWSVATAVMDGRAAALRARRRSWLVPRAQGLWIAHSLVVRPPVITAVILWRISSRHTCLDYRQF